MKIAQSTIKIQMKSDFSSDLTPFLAIMHWGGGGGPPNEIYSYAPADCWANLAPPPAVDLF